MQPFCAAFLIIGNEILSGRTAEKNLPELAELLGARGWQVGEVRVCPDVQEEIVAAVNALRRRYEIVFTSGGIGPTHDDITTDSVAAALGCAATEHADALHILTAFYDSRGMEFTAARRRMARTPAGAQVIASDFPGAPAYRAENVIVCAGVPDIFKMMAAAAVAALPTGVRRTSSALRVFAGESVFADALAQVAADAPAVEVGSYPREENGAYVCQVVFTAADDAARQAAQEQFCAYLRGENLPFEVLN